MSDEHEEHDWVRRMLAEEGRSPEPTPPWVRERIEETLEELRAPEDPPVVRMTPRRHRRWAAALLAAAALTVGGYSLVATGLLDRVSTGQAESSAGDATAGDAAAENAEAADGGAAADTRGMTTISSTSLRADARSLVLEVRAGVVAGEPLPAQPAPQEVQGESAGPRDPAGSSTAPREQLDARLRPLECTPPPPSRPGVRRPVGFDGDPATAVVRRLDGGRFVVTVFACDAPRRLAQVTVRP